MPPTTIRTITTVQGIQGEVAVQRWTDDDPDRYSQNRGVRLLNTELDESIEIVVQEEAYELAQALLDQVVWLSRNEPEGSDIEEPPEPCDHIVVRVGTEASGRRVEVIGPMTREACTPEWWDAPDVAWIACVPLTRPPLV